MRDIDPEYFLTEFEHLGSTFAYLGRFFVDFCAFGGDFGAFWRHFLTLWGCFFEKSTKSSWEAQEVQEDPFEQKNREGSAYIIPKILKVENRSVSAVRCQRSP